MSIYQNCFNHIHYEHLLNGISNPKVNIQIINEYNLLTHVSSMVQISNFKLNVKSITDDEPFLFHDNQQ